VSLCSYEESKGLTASPSAYASSDVTATETNVDALINYPNRAIWKKKSTSNRLIKTLKNPLNRSVLRVDEENFPLSFNQLVMVFTKVAPAVN